MKCLALLTCDKIIIDKDGTHSIINVMLSAAIKLQKEELGQPPQDLEIPANAVTPNQWWIYAQWEPTSGDVGKSFRAKFQVFWPNGDKLVDGALPFTQSNESIQQTTFFIGGFPVGQQGKVKIVTWLESPEEHRVTDIMETHVTIEHPTGNPPGSPKFSLNMKIPSVETT